MLNISLMKCIKSGIKFFILRRFCVVSFCEFCVRFTQTIIVIYLGVQQYDMLYRCKATFGLYLGFLKTTQKLLKMHLKPCDLLVTLQVIAVRCMSFWQRNSPVFFFFLVKLCRSRGAKVAPSAPVHLHPKTSEYLCYFSISLRPPGGGSITVFSTLFNKADLLSYAFT